MIFMFRRSPARFCLVGAFVLACAQMQLLAQEAATPPAPPAEISPADLARFGESPIAAILEGAGPDAREFNDHVTTLANPFFEGRVPGVRGNALAGDYIQWYFTRAGLKPAFATEAPAADGTPVLDPNTGFRQEFQAGTTLRVTAEAVELDLGGAGHTALQPGKDFTVLGTSGNGKVSGAAVFVGYSITDPEGQDYTSYPAGTDLSGKIAVVFRFEPMDERGQSRWSKGGWSPAAALDGKLKAAAEHHAAGIILVNPPGADDPRAKELSDTQSTRGAPLSIPVVMVTPEAAEKLVRAGAADGGPRTLMDLRKAADERGGVVDLPGAHITIETTLARDPVMTSNVGAVLPGRGALKDQYIILGAHYDHVGYGPVGVDPSNQGKLHPGADDNASGTSALLVLAGKLARTYEALPADASARSVLFLAFSAEESGLNGSHYFVAHPSIKPERMSLMINMDMVGRLRTDPPLDVEGTQSAEGFYDWLAPYFEKSGIKITHGANVASNSDHYSFYARKVPVLFFFTGYHKDYHKPGDFAWKINQLGAARIISLVHDITLAAAQRSESLVFAEPKKKEEEPGAGPVHGSRVKFGIAPGNYGDVEGGVLVGDVSEGWSAAKAGVKAGDKLVKWNGKTIDNVNDWMPMLAACRPGDVVDVTVLRDGKEQVIKVTMMAAPQNGR